MNFVTEFLSSGGKISSKRVITTASFLLYAILVLAEQFFVFKTNPVVLEGLMYIIISGLGLTASEKFSKKSKEKENGPTSTEEND
jgi:hypothetical protein